MDNEQQIQEYPNNIEFYKQTNLMSSNSDKDGNDSELGNPENLKNNKKRKLESVKSEESSEKHKKQKINNNRPLFYDQTLLTQIKKQKEKYDILLVNNNKNNKNNLNLQTLIEMKQFAASNLKEIERTKNEWQKLKYEIIDFQKQIQNRIVSQKDSLTGEILFFFFHFFFANS